MTSIEAVEEGEDLPVVQPSHIRVWFSSERDHGVSWKARCNGYGADARITARKIEISGMGSTLIGCPAPQGREDAWLTRFMEAMPEWRLEGERLQLSTDFATLRLRDVRAPAASGH
jgi:heat shock protein HslJ